MVVERTLCVPVEAESGDEVLIVLVDMYFADEFDNAGLDRAAVRLRDLDVSTDSGDTVAFLEAQPPGTPPPLFGSIGRATDIDPSAGTLPSPLPPIGQGYLGLYLVVEPDLESTEWHRVQVDSIEYEYAGSDFAKPLRLTLNYLVGGPGEHNAQTCQSAPGAADDAA